MGRRYRGTWARKEREREEAAEAEAEVEGIGALGEKRDALSKALGRIQGQLIPSPSPLNGGKVLRRRYKGTWTRK